MEALPSITVALILTFLGAEIGRKFHYPRVIGQLVISLVLTVPLLKNAFGEESLIVIHVLSGLGVVFLLLLTGFKLNIEELKKNKKEAFLIAIFAAIIPFLLGVCVGCLLQFEWKTSVVLGACLAVTAEGTKVSLLLETKKIKTRLSSIMLGAGILDDIFEVIFLSTIVFFAHDASIGKIDFIS
jgi:Kef-type K+ transport system membrane component KefB